MPELKIDLHTHSTASDGSLTPAELVRKAAALPLGALALTDHDTTSGLEEFLHTAAGFPQLHAVPGVELSTNLFTKEVHILGLFIDPSCTELGSVLKQMREERDRRNSGIVQLMQNAGYEITMEEVLAEAGGESVGRPHIGRVLLRKGYFKNMKEIFEKCLKRGAKFYLPRRWLPPDQLIHAVHAAGGLAIWAHPLSAQSGGRSLLRKFLKVLIPAGLDGMETYYTTFTPYQHELAQAQAQEFHLLESGGSDFHGANQPGIFLGSGTGSLSVPYELYEKLQNAHIGKKTEINGRKSD